MDLTPGQRWLAAKSPTDRKRLGQWATPLWVVEAVVHRYAAALPPGGVVLDPSCGDGRWLAAVGRRRPDARLVGVDVDPDAITAATATCQAAGVSATLRCADALADPSPLPPADWIVGNPPFVRPQNLPRAIRQDLWRRFATATDKADLYACFVERCLATAPRLTLVLPEAWLHLHSFSALRTAVLTAGIEAIWTLPRRAFDTVPVPTIVLVTGRADDRVAGRLEADADHGRFVPTGTIHVEADAWSLQGPLPSLPGTPLADHVSLHMGVVCGDYPRYVHQGHRHPEDRPTCRGRDVRRWTIAPTDEHIRYDPRDMLDRKPYVAPKHAGLFDVPAKIILAGTTGTVLHAAMDTEQRFPLDSCYVLLPRSPDTDLWGLLGLLLSPQVGLWYGTRHRAARVKAVEVARIPLPPTPWTDIALAARERDEDELERAVAVAYAREG